MWIAITSFKSTYIGPFDTFDQACTYCERNYGETGWSVHHVTTPNKG